MSTATTAVRNMMTIHPVTIAPCPACFPTTPGRCSSGRSATSTGATGRPGSCWGLSSSTSAGATGKPAGRLNSSSPWKGSCGRFCKKSAIGSGRRINLGANPFSSDGGAGVGRQAVADFGQDLQKFVNLEVPKYEPANAKRECNPGGYDKSDQYMLHGFLPSKESITHGQ